MDALTGRELIDQFVAEALESLREVPRLLETFHQDSTQTEAIHAAFRAVHSIKGTSACLGLDAYKLFVHSLENLLSQIRDGKISLTDSLLERLIEGLDLLEGMLHSAAEGNIVQHLGPSEEAWLARLRPPSASQPTDRAEALQAILDELLRSGLPRAADLAQQIQALVLGEPDPSAPKGPKAALENCPAQTIPALAEDLPPPDPKQFTIGRYQSGSTDLSAQVHAIACFFQEANSHGVGKSALAEFLVPFDSFVRQLEATGETSIVQPLAGVLTDLRNLHASPIDLDAGLAELLWKRLAPELLRLRTSDCTSDSFSSATAYPEKIPTSADSPASVESPEKTPKESAPETPDQPPAQQIFSSKSHGQKSNGSAQPSRSETPAAAPIRYIRVKETYLDEFLEDVSHLFITGELLRELETRIPEGSLGRSLAKEFHQTCQDLRIQLNALHRSAASLRRVSAGELFAPYPRMARSLAAQLKKKVHVLLQGEEIEIDRALARELEAPLTHLVRNAVDHGIESPEERRNRGANEIGLLLLKAERSPHCIRMSVEDDGRGIDPDRIRQKAAEKGLLTPTQAKKLSDSEAIQLIFHPGFSTADKVSEISGRGVGMDVVRTLVKKHRGEVQVESTLGKGTKIHLTFPVREAVLVLDGLLIRHEGRLLVIPLEHLQEVVHLQPELIHTVQNHHVLHFRGDCYELLWVHEALGWSHGRCEATASGPAALVGLADEKICLRFEELLGHRQVVVRSLESVLPGCTKTQGVALLGGGRLALVLNIPEILAAYRPRGSISGSLNPPPTPHFASSLDEIDRLSQNISG